MLYRFIETKDDSKFACRFSLSSGASFFAIMGIIWWCSELVVRQNYKLSRLLDAKLFKYIYTVVFLLYLSCLLCTLIHFSK